VAGHARRTDSAGPAVKEVHRNYHIPISNTATGLMALEVV